MLNVCPNCHYVGKDKYNFSPNKIIYGTISTIFGLLLFLGTFLLENYGLMRLIAIILLIVGFVMINKFFKGRVCHNCGYKEMLPIDTPEAIKLIKQYDLQPGVNNFPSTFNEANTNPPFQSPKS